MNKVPRSQARLRLVVEGARWWFLAPCLALLLAPWSFMVADVMGGRVSAPEPSLRLKSAEATGPAAKRTAEGPWGLLETSDILIAPPLEFVDAMTAERSSRDWFFPGLQLDQFLPFLESLPLRAETRYQIASLARPDQFEQGVTVTPTEELVWSLEPEERAALYHRLGLHARNVRQSNAFRFAGTLEQWLSGADVSDEALELVEKLLYRNGEFLFLADIDVLLPRLHRAEQTPLLKALTRERTLEVRLRVREQDSIKQLAAYWGRGGRAKDVRPLLESLAGRPGGGVIDVAHLLPSFARSRLYTYPTPTWLEGDAVGIDCMWTAFNFFADTPDIRFARMDEPLKALKEDYRLVDGPSALGDVLVFIDGQETWFHSAIYIADNVVFTKNGNLSSTPWTYMRLDQMQQYFPRPAPIRMHTFRRKDS